jgi:hypothetical protein
VVAVSSLTKVLPEYGHDHPAAENTLLYYIIAPMSLFCRLSCSPGLKFLNIEILEVLFYLPMKMKSSFILEGRGG